MKTTQDHELENPVKDDVIKFAKKRGWVHRRFEIKKGDPDELFARAGRVILAEFKRPVGGVVSEIQKIKHAEWRGAGIEVHLINTREQGYVLFS